MTTHSAFEEMVAAYAVGALDADDRRAFEAHLASCKQCATELAALPRHAIVVNVARGALLDETALVAAIRSGHVRGAVLDVFAKEPLPADSPLWELPNVILTPHVSGVTDRYWEREMDLFVDNWLAYDGGTAMRNVVDQREGY